MSLWTTVRGQWSPCTPGVTTGVPVRCYTTSGMIWLTIWRGGLLLSRYITVYKLREGLFLAKCYIPHITITYCYMWNITSRAKLLLLRYHGHYTDIPNDSLNDTGTQGWLVRLFVRLVRWQEGNPESGCGERRHLQLLPVPSNHGALKGWFPLYQTRGIQFDVLYGVWLVLYWLDIG